MTKSYNTPIGSPQPSNADVRNLIAFKLARVTTLNDRIGQRLISQQLGLSLREFRTLATISYLGMTTTSALARESFLDFAQVSRVVSALIGRELVERVGSDGRGGVLRLTEAGREMMAQGMPFVKRQNARLVAGMPETDLATLMGLIDDLLGHATALYREVNGEISDLVTAAGTPADTQNPSEIRAVEQGMREGN